MDPIILKTRIEVANALAGIGLNREHLNEVIERMVTARNSCTANHPLGSAGYMAWAEGTCRLREIGSLTPGWERNNDDYIPSIYNVERKHKVAICNTDDGTGLEKRLPQNRNKKGAGMDRVVGANQEVFSELLEAAVNVIPISQDSRGIVFWYLCVYSEGDEVRAELSCPLECVGGFFKSFSKRIILIGGDDDDGSGVQRRLEPTDGVPGFDIIVTRKQA
jgi:hypothetical protein